MCVRPFVQFTRVSIFKQLLLDVIFFIVVMNCYDSFIMMSLWFSPLRVQLICCKKNFSFSLVHSCQFMLGLLKRNVTERKTLRIWSTLNTKKSFYFNYSRREKKKPKSTNTFDVISDLSLNQITNLLKLMVLLDACTVDFSAVMIKSKWSSIWIVLLFFLGYIDIDNYHQ